MLPLPLWAWVAKRTKVGGQGRAGKDIVANRAATPPPNPLPQGEGKNLPVPATQFGAWHHAFSAIFSPKSPCGRTIRNPSTSRNAKASLYGTEM